MNLKSLFALLVASAVAMAAESLTSAILTFPEGTPTSVIDDSKQAIIDGGGQITHEYSLINGFAADVPQAYLDSLSELDESVQPTVDLDTEVSINQ